MPGLEPRPGVCLLFSGGGKPLEKPTWYLWWPPAEWPTDPSGVLPTQNTPAP